MKILIVMGGYLPGKEYGGPPVSIDNFCTLMEHDNCFIVTHDHDLSTNKRYLGIDTGWNDRGNCKVLYLSDSDYSMHSFEKVILEVKPDVIYLQSIFQSCVLSCLYLSKKYKINVILAPRGELCSGAIKFKKYKKLPYLSLIKHAGLFKEVHFQSTSEEESEAIKQWLSVDDSHIHRLDNIPSIPRHAVSHVLKEKGIGKFVFISRIHPKKNLLSAINFFSDTKGTAIFDIYGSVEDETYWNECLQAIKKLPNNVKVSYKGLVDHDQIHSVFSQYDAFLFPTLSENYGHVIAESLLVGTPVIISDNTPWSDVSLSNAGWVYPLKDADSYKNAIDLIIDLNNDDYKSISECCNSYIRSKLDLNGLANEYCNVFHTLT